MSETAKRLAALGMEPIPGKPGMYRSCEPRPKGPTDTTEIRKKFEEWKLSEEKRTNAPRRRTIEFTYKCVDCGTKNKTDTPPPDSMLKCSKCGWPTVQTCESVKG